MRCVPENAKSGTHHLARRHTATPIIATNTAPPIAIKHFCHQCRRFTSFVSVKVLLLFSTTGLSFDLSVSLPLFEEAFLLMHHAATIHIAHDAVAQKDSVYHLDGAHQSVVRPLHGYDRVMQHHRHLSVFCGGDTLRSASTQHASQCQGNQRKYYSHRRCATLVFCIIFTRHIVCAFYLPALKGLPQTSQSLPHVDRQSAPRPLRSSKKPNHPY